MLASLLMFDDCYHIFAKPKPPFGCIRDEPSILGSRCQDVLK